MVRIVIADDHEIVRQGVKRILKTHAEWEIDAEADNGETAVTLAEQLNPDVIVMDISMPVMSGLEATRQISNLDLNIPVLVFTMHESNPLSGFESGRFAVTWVLLVMTMLDQIIFGLFRCSVWEFFFGDDTCGHRFDPFDS